MTLIVTRRGWNPLQSSKFFPEIKAIAAKKGLKSIGHVWIGEENTPWTCHKCEAKNPKPVFEKEILTECSGCHYPFLLSET